MARESDTLSFIMGLTVGALAGAVVGILFTPKTGEQARKDISDFANKISDQVTDTYEKANALLNKKVKNLQELGTKIDQTKYKALVDEVIGELKQDGEVTADVAKRLGTQLRTDWNKTKTTLSK